MSVTALFATAGATNAGLYPAPGSATTWPRRGQFPPFMGQRVGGRASIGLLIAAAGTILVVAAFDLSAIASLGSAVALLVFALVTAGHLRIRTKTGANVWILLVAVVTAVVVSLTFVFTTLIDEPASIVMLGLIVGLSLVLDLVWGRGVTPVDGAGRGRLKSGAPPDLPGRRSARARRQQPALVGRRDRRGPVVDVELRVDVEQVRLDGRLGDEQARRRAAVRLALGDQRQDLELAVAERVLRRRPELAHEPRRDRRGEDGLAAGRGADRPDQLSRGASLSR